MKEKSTPGHLLDYDLVSAFQAGDNSAFEELVKKYQQPVIKGCYRFLGNYPDSQDAAQEIFLKVYKALETFSPDAKFSTWLHRILVNHCLNVLRARNRKRLVNFGKGVEKANEEKFISAEKTPFERVQQAEKVQAVQRALLKLKEKQRVAIILHKFQGLSYKEIAEIQRCSLSALKPEFFGQN